MRSATAAVLARHGHRRSPRPEHRYLAISKSAHRAAGLRRIVCGTRCAVSSNRSLSIAYSSRGATALSPARPKRLFGGVGGRPAPARWRGSGRIQKRSVEHASHRRGPTSDSAILSELARCYCLHTARAQAACQGVDRQLTKTTGLHRTMAKVCKSDGQETFAGTQGNGEVAPIPDLPSLATDRVFHTKLASVFSPPKKRGLLAE
jgi:hypothetical protein